MDCFFTQLHFSSNFMNLFTPLHGSLEFLTFLLIKTWIYITSVPSSSIIVTHLKKYN